MKINNLGVNSTPYTSQQQLDALTAASGEPGAIAPAGQRGGYTPSTQLVQLLDLIHRQPEVREDRVQAALNRLQQGYYDTAAALDQTAAAMASPLSL